METKTDTKSAAAKKTAAGQKSKTVEPFAEVAEPTEVKKTAAKRVAAAPKAADVEAKPVKKAVRRTNEVSLDPFAETVEASSPVKKPSAKTAKAAKTETPVEAKADAPKKAAPKTAKAEPAAKSAKAAKPAAKKSSKKAAIGEDQIRSPRPAGRVLELEAGDPLAGRSPAFKLLAKPTLPELPRENRARLQMQTPTRVYFYWSVKDNPWARLRSVFGDDLGSYTLVHKLIDKRTGREEIHQTDAQGNYWFDVEPDRAYQAEIGFYAPNRPYFRILYSNTVETPRRSPSPRAATDADWKVSASKFAEVLDVAGFSRDAFDVAMAGDDQAAAEDLSFTAFMSFLGASGIDLSSITAEDIRYALLALAAGVTLEDLRHKISAALFEILQANAGALEPAKAMASLTEYFDIDEAEFSEEQYGPAVYGASLVNFPKTLKTRGKSPKKLAPKYSPRYNPVSSHNIR